MYKHPGHKVIVKRRGDLIVRPTYTENAVARYVFHPAAHVNARWHASFPDQPRRPDRHANSPECFAFLPPRRLPCSRSVRHHLLGSYIRSMMAVLRGQTRGKHIEGGVRSLLHMSRYGMRGGLRPFAWGPGTAHAGISYALHTMRRSIPVPAHPWHSPP